MPWECTILGSEEVCKWGTWDRVFGGVILHPRSISTPQRANFQNFRKTWTTGHGFWRILKNLKHTLGALGMHDFGFVRGVQVGDMGPGVWWRHPAPQVHFHPQKIKNPEFQKNMDGILKTLKHTLGALGMDNFGFMRVVQVGDMGAGVC